MPIRVPPWVSRVRKSQRLPEVEPPIPLGNRSNGEYFHEQTARERKIRELALARADALGRRLGLDRREFMASSLGMTATLWAINTVACGGDDGGGAAGTSGGSTGGSTGSTGGSLDDTFGDATSGSGYDLGDDPVGTSSGGEDCTPLDEDVFVLDAQTHHVDPMGEWRETNPSWDSFFEGLEQAACGLPDAVECFSAEQYIELMFLGSQTTVAVLSGVPSTLCSREMPTGCGNPLDNDKIAESRDMVNMLASSGRMLSHCMITPNVDLAAQLDIMQMVNEEHGVAGWKCYPPWGPTGTGWWLDDADVGIPFIEQARALDVKVICIHKGLPLPGFDGTHTNPRDVGVVAAMFPDVRFVVYHSAWLHGGFGNGEGPYDPDGLIDPSNPVVFPVDMGVNSLIQAVRDAGLRAGSNVYAELGSVWTNLMVYPDQAAHVIGKLMLHLGEDNVIWGTDCIWTGSPQGLIEAFWAFTIPKSMQETYGYPALTEERKRKILGLNGAALFGIDPAAMFCRLPGEPMAIARAKLDEELGPRRWLLRAAPGPRTRREFVRFAKHNGGPG
jgi:predicted TIM-barrel fold metal-dependent hydrolase